MTDPIVIFNACDRDAQMQMKCFDWMAELDGQQQADCVIAQDTSMNRIIAGMLLEKAGKAFAGVQHFTYERPWQVTWPHVGNWVWQTTARMVHAEIGRPWLWMEADMIPIVENWWPILCDKYAVSCAKGKPFMGSLIPGNGHLNGTAFYTADFAKTSVHAMKARDIAWDFAQVADMRGLQADCPEMVHRWGLVNGKAHMSEGPALTFRTQADVDNWVPKNAVTFHRTKDGTLIDRLRERRGNVKVIHASVDTLTGPWSGGGGGSLKL